MRSHNISTILFGVIRPRSLSSFGKIAHLTIGFAVRGQDLFGVPRTLNISVSKDKTLGFRSIKRVNIKASHPSFNPTSATLTVDILTLQLDRFMLLEFSGSTSPELQVIRGISLHVWVTKPAQTAPVVPTSVKVSPQALRDLRAGLRAQHKPHDAGQEKTFFTLPKAEAQPTPAGGPRRSPPASAPHPKPEKKLNISQLNLLYIKQQKLQRKLHGTPSPEAKLRTSPQKPLNAARREEQQVLFSAPGAPDLSSILNSDDTSSRGESPEIERPSASPRVAPAAAAHDEPLQTVQEPAGSPPWEEARRAERSDSSSVPGNSPSSSATSQAPENPSQQPEPIFEDGSSNLPSREATPPEQRQDSQIVENTPLLMGLDFPPRHSQGESSPASLTPRAVEERIYTHHAQRPPLEQISPQLDIVENTPSNQASSTSEENSRVEPIESSEESRHNGAPSSASYSLQASSSSEIEMIVIDPALDAPPEPAVCAADATSPPVPPADAAEPAAAAAAAPHSRAESEPSSSESSTIPPPPMSNDDSSEVELSASSTPGPETEDEDEERSEPLIEPEHSAEHATAPVVAASASASASRGPHSEGDDDLFASDHEGVNEPDLPSSSEAEPSPSELLLAQIPEQYRDAILSLTLDTPVTIMSGKRRLKGVTLRLKFPSEFSRLIDPTFIEVRKSARKQGAYTTFRFCLRKRACISRPVHIAFEDVRRIAFAEDAPGGPRLIVSTTTKGDTEIAFLEPRVARDVAAKTLLLADAMARTGWLAPDAEVVAPDALGWGALASGGA